VREQRGTKCCRLGRSPCHGNLPRVLRDDRQRCRCPEQASDLSCLPSCVRACHPSLRSWHTPPRSPSPSSLRVTAQCHRPSPCPGRASRARPPARQLHGIHCRAQRVLQTEAFSSSTEPSGARLNFQVVELPETECMHLRAPATSTRLNRTPSSS
jgi:hypothetical protein